MRHGIERAQSKIHVDTLAAEKRREQQILVTQIDRLKQTLVQNETAVEEAHDALQVFDDMRLDLEAYKQSLKQFNDVNNMLAKSNMSVALQKAHISCLKCNIEDFDQQLEKAALVEGGLKNEIKNLSAELSALRESYVGQEREIYNLKTTIEEERGHVSR